METRSLPRLSQRIALLASTLLVAFPLETLRLAFLGQRGQPQ